MFVFYAIYFSFIEEQFLKMATTFLSMTIPLMIVIGGYSSLLQSHFSADILVACFYLHREG